MIEKVNAETVGTVERERERERERATLYSTWNLFIQSTILSKNNLRTNKKLYSNPRISSIKNAKNKIIKIKDRLLKIACPFRAVKNNKQHVEKWVIDTS